MKSIWDDMKPRAAHWSSLPYVGAALAGLVYPGVMAGTWYSLKPRPADVTLQQALYAFDTGHLAPATQAFQALADRGDPHAAFWYGHALDYGLGVPVDTKAAVKQYEKAAAGGVIQADARLGELYLDGNRVLPDFSKARSYLTVAAKAGNAPAAIDLARMLKQGIGSAADPVGAYAWLEVASLERNALARSERDRLLPSLSPAQQAQAIQQAHALVPSAAGKDGSLKTKA
jgi:TPR repeat protein